VHGGARLWGVSNSGEDSPPAGDASTSSFGGRKPVLSRELRRTFTGDGSSPSSSRSTVSTSVAVRTDVADSLRGMVRALFSLIVLSFS
jgi:hypothetical protein